MNNGYDKSLVGQAAPDFTLENEDGAKITLSELKGQPVVLIFYPFDWSGTCTTEICGLRDNFGAWQSNGAALFGISRDSRYSHKAWKEHLGFTYSLLADLVGDVAKKYNAWNDAAHRAERVTIIIDPQGIVRYELHNSIASARDNTEALKSLHDMAVAAA